MSQAEQKNNEVGGAAEAFLDFLRMPVQQLTRVSATMFNTFGRNSVSYRLSSMALSIKEELIAIREEVNSMEGPGEMHLDNLYVYGICGPNWEDEQAAIARDDERAAGLVLNLLSDEPNLYHDLEGAAGAAATQAQDDIIDLTNDPFDESDFM